MRKILTVLTLAMLAGASTIAQAAEPSTAPVARPFKPAPSADLDYAIEARQRGFTLPGTALISWRAGDGKYSVQADTKSPLLGKIVENHSDGAIDTYGLAPAQFTEKKMRKPATNTAFNRDAKTISFTDGKLTFPLVGGEQDRASAAWQLVGLARAAPEKFVAGSTWTFFVAGTHDGEPWTFKVVNREKVALGEALGDVDAVHVLRAPPAGDKGQTLDIWLAPSLEWYPARLRFTEGGDFIEQRLSKITKK